MTYVATRVDFIRLQLYYSGPSVLYSLSGHFGIHTHHTFFITRPIVINRINGAGANRLLSLRRTTTMNSRLTGRQIRLVRIATLISRVDTDKEFTIVPRVNRRFPRYFKSFSAAMGAIVFDRRQTYGCDNSNLPTPYVIRGMLLGFRPNLLIRHTRLQQTIDRIGDIRINSNHFFTPVKSYLHAG